jgi:hypothetical protein
MSYFSTYNQAREQARGGGGNGSFAFSTGNHGNNTTASAAQRFKTKYLIIHCKHVGCYDFNFIEHRETKARFIPVTINTPKVFMFENKEEAREFFNEYMTDVDVVDPKCRLNGEIQHVECCSCGVIDLDEEEQPNLFYNKTNQIFLLEHTAETFMANQSIRSDINNLNITNNFMKKCKSMPEEQRRKYIELGKMCEECNLEGYLEKVEREEEEKRKEAEKKMKEDEKRLEAEEKRRKDDTEQLAETIFTEIEKKLGNDRKAMALLDEIKQNTNIQLNIQFAEQIDQLKKALREPQHKPNTNSDEPRNVIITEVERRPRGPLAAAKGTSLFAPPPTTAASVTASPSPVVAPPASNPPEVKKRKYTKKTPLPGPGPAS